MILVWETPVLRLRKGKSVFALQAWFIMKGITSWLDSIQEDNQTIRIAQIYIDVIHQGPASTIFVINRMNVMMNFIIASGFPQDIDPLHGAHRKKNTDE